MYLQQSKLNTKNVTESHSPCHFETVVFEEFFSLTTFKFVTRK